MSAYLDIFASNLKTLRKFHKMKQEELSQKTEITRTNLSYYESAKNDPMLTSLIKISNVFNLSIDELIKNELTDEFLKERQQKKNNKRFSSLSIFSKNLKRLRKSREMYQVGLAKELSIAKSNISVYEAGTSDITLTPLIKIADYFNVSITELVSTEITPENFMKSETSFFEKVSIDMKSIDTDEGLLDFLVNLKAYYSKQSEKLENKIREIDEIINFIKEKRNNE